MRLSLWRDTDRVMMASEVRARFGVEMQPCPFCGSRNVGVFYASPTPHGTCGSCEADGPLTERRDEGAIYSAALLWNQRGPQPDRFERRGR